MGLKSPPSLLQGSPYICPSCCRPGRMLQIWPLTITSQKRSIGQAYIFKTEEAKANWARQATEIKEGRKESMLSLLEKRGFVNQIVGGRDDLDRLLIEKRIGAYVGVDPTAASMHVGHLVPLMALFWMYFHGFKSCSLLGGATARIGDPSGRATTRAAQDRAEQKANMARIHYQLKTMWAHIEKKAVQYGFKWEWAWRRELTNNNAWLNKLPIIDILNILGPGVRLGTMLGRDTVKTRLKSRDGMSLAEFVYPLLQSWDWWYMYHTKGIQVQIGGSDQFGNILAGIDGINYIRRTYHDPDYRDDENTMTEKEALAKRPMGFTVPLLTTSSGKKFGKSAGNAIWLDQDMTSAFDLYQFFLRTADADVHRYLKLFTFEPLDELEKLVEAHQQEPSRRIAQHKLAREVLEIVHGKELAKKAEAEHASLFTSREVPKYSDTIYGSQVRDVGVDSSKRPSDMNRLLNEHAPIIDAENAPNPNVSLPRSLVYNQPVARVLYHAGMVASRSEGHRLIARGGAYIGSKPGQVGAMGDHVDFTPIKPEPAKDTEKFVIDGGLLILRIGKWKIKVVKIFSDDEFDEKGLTAPGWEEEKAEKLLTVSDKHVQ